MREIKFRAWNDIDKSYIDWMTLCGMPRLITNTARGKEKHYKLEQYTGLNGKDERDVYEGDIVSLNKLNQIESSDIYFEVKWCSENHRWIIYHSDVEFYDLIDFDLWVIGNIHQNSELLK